MHRPDHTAQIRSARSGNTSNQVCLVVAAGTELLFGEQLSGTGQWMTRS